MAGSKKAVNKMAKRFAGNGEITEKEAEKIQQQAASSGTNNAAVAIARAAANNQAKIAESVQRSLGIEQNKNLTKASVTPQANIFGSGAPSGMDAYVSGYKQQSSQTPKGGSTTNQVPVYTFSKKNNGAGKAAEPAATDKQEEAPAEEQKAMNNQTNQWSDSVDNGMSELEQILAKQMEANAQQTSLYMGMMQDMMAQMTAAQQSNTPQGAYSVSTYQTPATGAQTTKEIDKRKPVANDSLSISSTPSSAPGVGLNLAI